MTANFSIREMADMIYCYGLSDGNNRQAHAIYSEKYPKRRIPSPKIFSQLYQRLVETGSLLPQKLDSGRGRAVLKPAVEERILRRLEDDPKISIRKLAASEGISRSSAWAIIRDHKESLEAIE